jgi:hypothetical protein
VVKLNEKLLEMVLISLRVKVEQSLKILMETFEVWQKALPFKF